MSTSIPVLVLILLVLVSLTYMYTSSTNEDTDRKERLPAYRDDVLYDMTDVLSKWLEKELQRQPKSRHPILRDFWKVEILDAEFDRFKGEDEIFNVLYQFYPNMRYESTLTYKGLDSSPPGNLLQKFLQNLLDLEKCGENFSCTPCLMSDTCDEQIDDILTQLGHDMPGKTVGERLDAVKETTGVQVDETNLGDSLADEDPRKCWQLTGHTPPRVVQDIYRKTEKDCKSRGCRYKWVEEEPVAPDKPGCF